MPVAPNVPLIVPVGPNVPVVKDPGQGVAETLGTGMPTVVLSPAVPNSVAPSGIVPPPPADPRLRPVVGVTPMPGPLAAALPVAFEPQELPMMEPNVVPPPSNEELDPVMPVFEPAMLVPEPITPVLDPVIPVLDPVMPVLVVGAPKQGVVPASGLIPPGLSSVAPSGIPTGPDGALKFIVPSGDVAPMPGEGLTWARPLLQPTSKMTMARSRRIATSVSFASPPHI